MEKIFYTDKTKFPNSEAAVKALLSSKFAVSDPVILRSDNGKPYLAGGKDIPLFFSVSHTANTLFIAVADENVGIDAEKADRQVDHSPIVRKFDEAERLEIRSSRDFLKHFVAKESAVKWLGGTLAHDLYALKLVQNRLYYGNIELPAHLAVWEFSGFLIAVCSERDFAGVTPLPF